MSSKWSWALAAGLAALLPVHQAVAETGMVLDGVTIVDTHDGSLKPNMAILITGGKIARIAKAGSIKAGKELRIVAERGKFVVPGYLDMHAHPLNSPAPEISLPMMVANGITGYRQMAGSDALLLARKGGKLPSPIPSPELLATPGMVLAGPALAGNRDAAVAEASKQIDEGADFIKVVDLGPPAFFAALETARGAGLPFVGHLPPTIDVREAARRGMGSVEHLGPNASLLEACSTDEAAIRDAYRKQAAGGRINFNLPPEILKKLVANPVLLTDPAGFALLQHMLDTYDEGKCRALAKELAGTAMYQVPTLIRIKTMDYGDDAMFSAAPSLRYVPMSDRESWQDIGKTFTARISPSARSTLHALFAQQMHLLKLFDQEGVKLLAGTDFGGQWIVPGISLHQEFDLLAEAGLSPLHILQMTTLNGARFLGREASMGSVQMGKNADLVVIKGNPIASAQNLHHIDAVVCAGVYLSRGELDAIEQRAATAAANPLPRSAALVPAEDGVAG